MEVGKESTVRGMLARASLLRRAKDKILDNDNAALIAEWLQERGLGNL